MSVLPAVAGGDHAPQARVRRDAILAWLIVAVLNFLAQIALRRELAPGEFGAVNTVLGIAAVLAAPLLALEFVFAQHMLPEEHAARWREGRTAVLELMMLVWGAVALVLFLICLPLLSLPRESVHFIAMLCVGACLLAVSGRSRCLAEGRIRFWMGLAIVAAAVRLAASVAFSHEEPWAQSGLAAVIAAGIIAAVPALRARRGGPTGEEAWALVRETAFLERLLPTASVMIALALFTNADRFVAQANFGTALATNFDYVDWRRFDDYQAAGMLARALLWGTAPLLLVVYGKRAALARTSKASLHFFWIYLFALFGGDLILGSFAPFLSWIFTGAAGGAARFIPGFAGAVPMLGLLQGVGMFALASRRHPECFVLGGCAVAYTIVLYLFGHEPQVMTSCMFGGALISLMTVLLVGIVRYARTHP